MHTVVCDYLPLTITRTASSLKALPSGLVGTGGILDAARGMPGDVLGRSGPVVATACLLDEVVDDDLDDLHRHVQRDRHDVVVQDQKR